MQYHRVFIAINFSENERGKMWLEANQFSDFRQRERSGNLFTLQSSEPKIYVGDPPLYLPLRITKAENLHLTPVFIGYVNNEELVLLIDKLPQIAQRHSPFDLKLSHLAYGPDEKRSRMIWIKGEAAAELLGLQEDLNTSLEDMNLRFFRSEKRAFTVHVTIARMKEEEWGNWQNKPEINKEVKFIIPVNSIELMESSLKRSGAEYTVLQSFELG